MIHPTHTMKLVANGKSYPCARFGKLLVIYHDAIPGGYVISFIPRKKAITLVKVA